jgi:hypothetical protein
MWQEPKNADCHSVQVWESEKVKEIYNDLVEFTQQYNKVTFKNI